VTRDRKELEPSGEATRSTVVDTGGLATPTTPWDAQVRRPRKRGPIDDAAVVLLVVDVTVGLT